MESSDIKSAFIRQDFLLCCLICGKTRTTNEAPFRNLGNECGNETEKELADLVKKYVGLTVNRALCCNSCFLTLKNFEDKIKFLRDRCKKTVKSVTFFVTSDADEDHNYCMGSDDKFIGSLKSDNYENILPAEIVISNDNIHISQDSIVKKAKKADHKKKTHLCGKCNTSFISKSALGKHCVIHTEEAEKQCVLHKEEADKQKNCKITPRRTLRKSVKTKFPDHATEDVAPAKIRKMAVPTSTRTLHGKLRPKSRRNVNYSQAESDKEEDAHGGVNEDVIAVLSSDKTLVEALLKPNEDARIFKCHHCPAEFSSSLRFSKHKEVHENLYWENANDNITVTGESAGVEAVLSDDNDKQFQCKICGTEFSTGKESIRHMKKVHSDKGNFYKCKICSKSFTSLTYLRAHLYHHFANKPFKCHCGKAFAKKCGLTQHARTHTVTKSHLCQFCGKLLTTKDSLDYHTKSIHLHAIIKDHICEICGKAFDRNSKLDIHKRIHTKEKDYLCDTCGHQYKDPNVLIQHRKYCGLPKTDEMVEESDGSSDKLTKTLNKPRKNRCNVLCKACLKRFPNLSMLTDHITVVHEKECIGCGDSITSWKSWRAHKQICSKRTNRVSLSNRFMSSIFEDAINESMVAESPVNPTKEMKGSDNLMEQNTEDHQEDENVDNHNSLSEPHGDSTASVHLIETRKTDLAGEPQVSEAGRSETIHASDETDTEHATTSVTAQEHLKPLDIVQGLQSINSHFIVAEIAGPDKTTETGNQPYLSEDAINEHIVKESVELPVDSKIFPTEPVTDVSSFLNPSTIFRAFGSGDHVNSIQTEGQETIYVVLQDGMNATELQYTCTPNQKVEFIHLEDNLPSTEFENITVIDPDLSVIGQDSTVQFLSPDTQL